jgi:hypothetical protein
MSCSFTKRCCFLVIGLLVLLFSCSKEPEPYSIINIGDQFELQLIQILSIKGGIPAIQVNSIRPHECTNAFISHQAIVSEDKVKIILNDILVEGICISGSSIVSEEIILETPNSGAPIEIVLKDAIVNHGVFYSEQDEIELIFNQFDGLKISKTHLNRILPKMMWGSFSLSKNEIATQLNDYLENLNHLSNALKGDYGYFYLAQDQAVTIYGDEGDYAFSFLISTNESFNKIKAQFEEFKELDESLILKATNYDGSSINIH